MSTTHRTATESALAAFDYVAAQYRNSKEQIMEPDGLEERTAFYEESFAADDDEIELEALLADEHDAEYAQDWIDEQETKERGRIPVRCIVNGHEFDMYRGLTYCKKCGQEKDL